jgi:hypothetical protein
MSLETAPVAKPAAPSIGRSTPTMLQLPAGKDD